MFKAMNYANGSFTHRFGIVNDGMEARNLHAWQTAEERNYALARLRSGDLTWDEAGRLPGTEPGYTLTSGGVNWQGQWTEVHVPTLDDPTAPDASPVTDTVPAHELARANERVEQLQRELATARAPITDVNDERLTGIWERAAQVASDEGFCPEYDRLANGLGIPGRERTYRGIVTVTFNVYAYARGTMRDVVEEEMQENVREAVRNLEGNYGEPGAITHVDFERVEVDDVDVYS